MFSVSTKTRYGLRALILLNTTSKKKSSPISIQTLAAEEDLSIKYLENIFIKLKRAGIVNSTRGKEGGYKLALPPEKINLFDIAQALEGPLFTVSCTEENHHCPKEDFCKAHIIWETMQSHVTAFMKGISLASATQSNIYMDHNATTPVHPSVQRAILESFRLTGNPSSLHSPGRQAQKRVDQAIERVESFLNAPAGSIVFTSGGTESDNLALTQPLPEDKNEILVSAVEHPGVIEFFRNPNSPLRGRIRLIPVDSRGIVRPDDLEAALSEKTGLVSIMMANNETGALNPIQELAKIAHRRGVLFHTDAVQALGKIPVDVKALNVDYLSFSGHKIEGPKGIGGLYVKPGAPFSPGLMGGHQQQGRRAGTLNPPGFAGLDAAVQIAAKRLNQSAFIKGLRNRLKQGLLEKIPHIIINTPQDPFALPNTLNVSFEGAEGEALLLYMDMAGLAVSTGSACASGSLDPSHVLLALGADAERAHGSVRFSLGGNNTEKEVDRVLDLLPPIVEKIRRMSTVYKGETK